MIGRTPWRLARVRPGGLRARLLAGFLAIALLSSVLASGFGYVLARRAILRGVQDQILNTFRDTVERAAPVNMPVNGKASPAVLQQIADAAGTRSTEIWITSGNRHTGFLTRSDKWGTNDVPADLLRAARTRFVFQRRIIRGEPVLIAGTPIDVVIRRRGEILHSGTRIFLFTSLRTESDQLSALAGSMALAALVALIIAAAFALFAAQGVLVPVRRLGRASLRLGMGRLDTRVKVRGRDELAQLGEMFNASAAVLERNVTELREAEAQSRRFVADVSHELRTPLTAMTAVTDLLADDAAAMQGDTGNATRLVVDSTRRLSALVANLIEVSRFDNGTAALTLDDVCTAQVIRDCLAARGWSGEVETDLAGDLTRVRLDPRRFDVVVANLVGNALKHGAPPVGVRLRTARLDGRDGVELQVVDHGSGIDADILPHVFDRFYKADAARPHSAGSGLGLAIAQANVALHGGTIGVHSDSGGTVFTAWLPAEPPERAGPPAPIGPSEDAGPAGSIEPAHPAGQAAT